MLPSASSGLCTSLSAALLIFALFYCIPLGHATVIIDNNDPRVKYLGAWNNVHDSSSSGADDGPDYNGTLTLTTAVGATMQLNFTGSNVIVYGIVSPAFNVAVKCTLDDSMNPVGFVVNGSTTSTELHHYALCRSGTIPYDLHTITVENIGDELWIASIQVESLSEPSASTSDVAPTAFAGSSDQPNGQVNPLGAKGSTKGLSPGALGGVIVAGAVAILVVLVLGLYFRERRQKLRGPRYTTYPRDGNSTSRRGISTLAPTLDTPQSFMRLDESSYAPSRAARLAGGVPDLEYGAHLDHRTDDHSSIISTLPPAYEPYPKS